jgi:cytochrome c biogenesis protein CcmG, thiol:disulfide interchange protein DsbE
MRRFITIERVLWAAAIAFIAFRVWPQLAAAAGAGGEGTAAPSFEVTTLEGEQVTLADLSGQVVLLNFWATWCPPCRVEMPGFQKVYDRHREAGFTIVGISTDLRGRDHVREFLEERSISYPVAMATGSVVRDYGGATALPTSFLIDRRGNIRHQVRGYFAETTLNSAVEKLLAER